ncbi:hypothetical protein RintRC_6719 [Richelia intracellularis]|nr:hypothetical protein RintRC_6719 [Richelia intracellularis]
MNAPSRLKAVPKASLTIQKMPNLALLNQGMISLNFQRFINGFKR